MSGTDLGDPNQIIHIPARELVGTREAKLAELDAFLAQLQIVRLALSVQAVRIDGDTARGASPRRFRDLVNALTSVAAPRARGGRA